MPKLIYAADDEKNIRDLLEIFLKDAGYNVEIFESGDKLYERFNEQKSDLVILDIMMPGTDGLEICRKLREKSDVPIIMLTAKDTETDFIVGMSVGSDDYIMKPFRPTMLLMKIKAIFKRIDIEHQFVMKTMFDRAVEESKIQKNSYSSSGTSSSNDDIRLNLENGYKIGNLIISGYEKMIYDTSSGQNFKLSMTEFAVLEYMAGYPKKAVSREELLENIWGIDSDIETRVVDETIRKIRKKLKSFDSKVKIETVWGHGYRMVEVNE